MTDKEQIEEPHVSKQIVESSYDLIAPRYLEWTTASASPRVPYLHKLLALIPKDSKVLELGCGAGVPGTQLLATQCEVTGNDISAVQIELARKHVPSAKFIHGDMMKLEFPAESYDAVVAFYSIIHLPREEQVALMGRIVEWLKNGGYLLINLGATDNPGSVKKDWLGGKMYWSGFDAKTNREMVEKAGLEIVEAEVIEDDEDGRLVPFLWILARSKSGQLTTAVNDFDRVQF